MPPKFLKIFFITLTVIVGVLFLLSDNERKINPEKVRFKTTESAELRFKNLRSYYYNIQNFESSYQDVYRFRNAHVYKVEENGIHFIIINHWIEDEAFIIPEFFGELRQYDSLQIKWSNGKYTYNIGDLESAWIFAAHIYMGILNKDSLFYFNQASKEWMPLLEHPNEKNTEQNCVERLFYAG
ncbi:MAG: hypothetical protein KatS3mg027_1913 [Bacteroidia bacterium]|nr:MAG: hypothetical protein KatS3mg027_1913 [Bacteroidia bacterium]